MNVQEVPQSDWIKEYESRDALWIHDGDMQRPHAELTSDRHSSGFFNSSKVAEDPLLLDAAARDLVDRLLSQGLDIEVIDRVVGPAMGAITWAHDVARVIGQYRGRPCLCAYVEKVTIGSIKTMRFSKVIPKPGERLLEVEDVLTTGGSVKLMTDAIDEVGAIGLPFVGVLVNRSGLSNIDGKRITGLIDRKMLTWESDNCPLCRAGSLAIRPKDNWKQLTQS